MKAKLVLTSFAALSIVNCGAVNKFGATAQGKLDEASSKFNSFDMTCEFGEIASAKTDDKGAVTATATDDKGGRMALTDDSATGDAKTYVNKCEKAQDYYEMLLKNFDVDHDGKLSEAELEKSRGEFEQEKKRQLDKNLDGVISEAEKTAWRAKELPARNDKLAQELQAKGAVAGASTGTTVFSDVRREDRREDRGLEVEAGDDKGGLGAVDDSGRGRGRRSDDNLSRLGDD